MNAITITLIVLSVALLGEAVALVMLGKRISRLVAGKNAQSLEDTIASNQRSLNDFYAFKLSVESELAQLDARMKKKIHGVRTLRFNPFAGTGSGGNQSFATAFLDEEGSGAVVSSLYSRDKVSIFAKPVKNRASDFELTDEEREVLT
jgi:hypothetical protein